MSIFLWLSRFNCLIYTRHYEFNAYKCLWCAIPPATRHGHCARQKHYTNCFPRKLSTLSQLMVDGPWR